MSPLSKVVAGILALIILIVLIFGLGGANKAFRLFNQTTNNLTDELNPERGGSVSVGTQRIETRFLILRIRDDIQKAFQSSQENCYINFSDVLPQNFDISINVLFEEKNGNVTMNYEYPNFPNENWNQEIMGATALGWIDGKTKKDRSKILVYEEGEFAEDLGSFFRWTSQSKYRFDVAKKEGKTLYFYYNPSAEELAFLADEQNKCR